MERFIIPLFGWWVAGSLSPAMNWFVTALERIPAFEALIRHPQLAQSPQWLAHCQHFVEAHPDRILFNLVPELLAILGFHLLLVLLITRGCSWLFQVCVQWRRPSLNT